MSTLLDLNAKVSSTDDRGRQVLALAACTAGAEQLRAIAAKGAKLEARDVHGWTPLFHAVAHGNMEATSTLLELGATVATTDKYGFTLLDVGIRKHRWEVIDMLLNLQEVEWGHQDLDSALGVAVRRGWWPLVEDLLDRGADVNTKLR